MKRTVSESRIPEYPTVSIDSEELKDSFVDARRSLDFVESEGELYRVQYHPPLFRGSVSDKIERGSLEGTVEGVGEHGGRISEDFSIEYEAELSDDFQKTLENLESAVESTEFEADFWEVGGYYEGVSGAEVAEAADGMALNPKMYLENDLDTDITLGWLRTAPQNPEVQFGISAFQNREYPQDSTTKEVLGRVLGTREDERNDHPLKEQEVQELRDLEQELANRGLF